MDDDFEIEITDLRGAPVSATKWWLTRRADDQPPDDDTFEIEVTDLRADPVPATASEPHATQPPNGELDTAASPRGASPLAPRRRWRARLVGGASAATVLSVALAVMLLGSPVVRGPLNTLFATPTATEPGADTFQLVNDAPWGKLAADGHTIAHAGFGGQPAFFRLDSGTHQVVYVAPPFPALRCQVSVPAAPSDTCPLAQQTSQAFLGSQPLRLEGARVLDLRASVDNLPPEQRMLLIAAVRALVASAQQQTVVNPGEHYLAADQSVQVARTTLHATQVIDLNANLTSGVTINGESCVMICSLPAPSGVSGGLTLIATITLNWRFATPSGELVAAATSQTPDGAPGAFTPLTLTATWHGAWEVSYPGDAVIPAGYNQVPQSPAAAAVAQVLCNLAQFDSARQITPSTDYGSIGWSGIAANPADGCVVVNQATNPEGQLVGQPEYLLYRFGVLLAASPVARQLNPDLPLADAYELALAQQAAAASEPAQFASNSSG